jgi:hypothetical protein
MSIACPNKNTKEWKDLVKQTGNTLANLAFAANGYRMPDVKSITEIKKEIKFQSKVENFAGVAARLRKYNQKNGTSHYFVYKPIWGNTFELTLKYNYLPVNEERQRQRMAAKGDPLYVVDDFDAAGFNYMYPGITNKNTGTSNIDELIPNAESSVVSAERLRKDKINGEIIKQRQKLTSITDPTELRKALTVIEKLKELLETAEERNLLAKNIKAFEDIELFGKKQLNEITQLLSNPAISADDLYFAQKIVNLWLKAGDFSTEANQHIFLDEDEFNTDAIRAKFRALAAQAQDLQSKLTTLTNDNVTKFVNQFTNGELTQEEIFRNIRDVSKIASETLNIARYGDSMLQAGFAAVTAANMNAQQEASKMWKNLDELTAKFLKKSGGNFNILKQLTEEGLETGRAVHRFSPEFFEIRNNLLKRAFWTRDPITKKLTKNPAAVKAFFDWTNSNTISFDPRALLPDTLLESGTMPESFLYKRVTFDEGSKQKHIAELKAQLGEKGYEYYIKRAEAKIDKFKILRESKYESIQLEENLSQDEKDSLFKDWLKEYSPYWGIDMLENPVSRKKGADSFYSPKGIREYVVQVPRKNNADGPTKWYDKNYAKIEADEDLFAYHSYMMETLNSLKYLLPEQKQAIMGVGVLPTIQKSLMDMYSEKGMMMGVIPFWDKMKELQTTTDLATTVYSDVDALTGDIEKNVQIQYLEDAGPKIRNIVKQKQIQHKQQTGKTATNADNIRFNKEAKDILSKEKSWDVTKILKAYSLNILAYKHQSFIAPQIKLLDLALKNREEIITNKAAQAQSDENGKPLSQKGLTHLKDAWDFFLDSTHYGIGARKVEGVSKTKLYTDAENKRKKELEELLKNETDEDSKQFLQGQIDSLGGFRTASGSVDALLKYMTLKGLGWNLFSASSNIGFGVISNLIQASDGRDYSMADLRKAYLLTTNSIGRNVSFNAWDAVNTNGVKIRTLMDKWDLLQTSNKEMFDMSQKSSMSKLKRFGPFSLQERSEYLNYAPVMIAVMMSKKPDGSPQFPAKDSKGEVVTMWDAYDIESGELKPGYTSDVDEIRMVQKIKRVIEMNHGDYNNALKVKSTVLGRALSQFRTWMFEGFANRFESGVNLDGTPKVDQILSYGLDEDYVKKGRYRSYTKGQLLTTGAAVGTMVLPGIGTAVGAGLGYLGGKFFGMQTEQNALSDTLFTLKQLARKLMFQKTKFGDRFNAVDAANIRKNMTELYIMMTLMGTALLLKSMAGDDDDEEQVVTNFLLNQTIRLRTDIGFYTNPLEFEKLTKTAVPMAALVDDVKTILSDAGNHLNDDGDDDVFESGPFKGQSKFFVHVGEALPLSSTGIRLYRTGQKVID